MQSRRRHKPTVASAFAVANLSHSRETHAAQMSLQSLFRIESSFVLLIFGVAASALLLPSCAAVGYSYTRFAGPVAGPEREVIVHDAFSGGPRIDYVAKPEYQFAYGVEDGSTRVLQNRKEERDGDAVTGVYSVVDPDGNLRVVKYTADNVNGFQAEVIANGIATLHGYNNNNNNNNNDDDLNNIKWYVQTGEPGKVQEVHHNIQTNTQPQEQQTVEPAEETESQKANKDRNSSDDDDDDDDDDDEENDSDGRSDYEVHESNDESDEEDEERDYGSSEEGSREAHSDDDYY